MPSPDELANLRPADDVDAALTENSDGSSTATWADGQTRVDYPDGSFTLTFSDGAVLNVYPDGTRDLNGADGSSLDPATGLSTEGKTVEPPTPPPAGFDAVQRALKGDEPLSDLDEAQELIGAALEAVESEITGEALLKALTGSISSLLKALDTAPRGSYMRGWCYAVLYDALAMGPLSTPSFRGDFSDSELAGARQGWNDGVTQATSDLAAGASGVSLRNRVLLCVARNNRSANAALDLMWQAACRQSGDSGSGGLAAAYPTLSWPEPLGL